VLTASSKASRACLIGLPPWDESGLCSAVFI
jgi:hypothetical protein